MNGFIRKTAAGSTFGLSLLLLVGGCYHYRELVDPCWPERYNYMARHSVRDFHNAQADKGHLLEQTVWNWHFERDEKTGAATDRLNGAGQEVLRRIARTLPAPDGQLFLQNAQDIPYKEGDAPAKIVSAREQLNRKRIDAIQRFMSTQNSTGPASFVVNVHDFAPPSLEGSWTLPAHDQIQKNIKNGIRQPFPAPEYSSK